MNKYEQKIEGLEYGSFLYPFIDIYKEGNECVLSTILRKEHDGIWYRWKFVRRYTDYRLKPRLLERLHVEVYMTMFLGIIDPTLLSMREGKPIFEVDKDQTSETDRLKKWVIERSPKV